MKTRGKSLQIDQLIFLLVIIVLAGLWLVVLMYTSAERTTAIERAREQLQLTVITLADFNELAEQMANFSTEGAEGREGSDTRTDALWRALLQYPAASIWVESNGAVTGGLPASDLSASIVVQEERNTFTVYAALPEAAALQVWAQNRLQRFASLAVFTLGFLMLTHFLVRAIRQRSEAELQAAASDERSQQLQLYREKLERTVSERTAELASANFRLGEELKERKATEVTLRSHDALLSSVTKGAAELLGSHNNDEAVEGVLELIGKTVSVSRVQLIEVNQERDGHFYANTAYEWCVPGIKTLLHDPNFQHVDLSKEFPEHVTKLLHQGQVSIHVDDIEEPYRQRYLQAEMQSMLHLPVYVEDKPWGTLTFIDSTPGRREWTWAETDTLRTLAGLVGASLTRARYLKELADANTIVQNSPTILYRLKGEPSLPLIYISHNITKFGHQARQLIGNSAWMEQLVDPHDREMMQQAMTRMQETGNRGAALEFRMLTGNGDVRWVENRYTPVRDGSGRLVEVEGIIIDITERKAAAEKIAAMARTDALTGLANRVTFNERLAQAFAATKRGANAFAVFYMDLDRFKTINDTLGHAVGDLMLKETALRLRNATRETDLVARLGGDEFAILQMDISEAANAGTLAKNIQTIINKPMTLDGNELHMTCSIGICPWGPDNKDPDNMLQQADLALYRAKEDGRNCFRFHSTELDKIVLERSALADELRLGIDAGQLQLAWQPQVSIGSGEIVGVEALVRWQHPRKGLLEAHDFVPVAEKTGTIVALGHWVLDSACRQLRSWRDEGIKLRGITVNLSLAQLKNSRELLTDVSEITAKWGLLPSDIEFDVTEAMLAQTTWTHNDVLSQLQKLGSTIAIDNFGTEYSSFDYLRAYAINHLKLARSFIKEATESAEHANTFKAIMQLARDLGVGLVVEGVETAEQNALLQSLNKGVNAQGYYYSRAMDGQAAGDLLKVGHAGPDAHLVSPIKAAGGIEVNEKCL